jgi:3-oxoadipate enol-lactonase
MGKGKMPKIKTGDIETYYEIHGEGEPLILIHGLGSSGQDWAY